MTSNPLVSTISGYTEEKRDSLIAASVLGAESSKYFTLETGVKGDQALTAINTEVVFGDGSVCGWNESGTTEYTQRIIHPAVLKVNMAYCDKQLLKTWMNYKVRVNAFGSDIPFEQAWTDQIVSKVNEKLEQMVWTGQASSTSFDGILTILSGETDVISGTTASGSSAYDLVAEVASKIPYAVENKTVFIGTDMMFELYQDLTAKNLFHYSPEQGASEFKKMVLPGTNVVIIGVPGLIGTNAAVGCNPANLYYACDLQGDEEDFQLFFANEAREWRLIIEFLAGVQIGIPSEVVYYTRATE